MMNYIHVNIQDPESLRLNSLSKRFNLSANHLSSSFKRQMGISIKKYIGDYKFKLIENRLKFSGSMMKEISNEFGFTDLSHFNKFFKNQGGINPKDTRRK
ncbi:helix-turn-helix domain-containing protein [Pedobacter sp. NJ-S-72]